MDNYL